MIKKNEGANIEISQLKEKFPYKEPNDFKIENCCDNPHYQYNEGYLVCQNCGMVKEQILVGQERRAYTNEEINRRVCNEPRWRQFGPRTVLPNIKKDYKGDYLKAKKTNVFKRLSKIQNSLVNSLERNLWEAQPKLKQIVLKLNLPDYIKDTAFKIYTSVADAKLTMGRSISDFVAASIYAAIRIHEFPRLLDDVADAAMVPRHGIVHSVGIIIKEILPKLNLKYNPITSEQLIFYFGNKLELPYEIQKQALNILSKASKNGLERNGLDPKGLAASVLYMAALPTSFKKTQKEVADNSKLSEVTLRSRIRDVKSLIRV